VPPSEIETDRPSVGTVKNIDEDTKIEHSIPKVSEKIRSKAGTADSNSNFQRNDLEEGEPEIHNINVVDKGRIENDSIIDLDHKKYDIINEKVYIDGIDQHGSVTAQMTVLESAVKEAAKIIGAPNTNFTLDKEERVSFGNSTQEVNPVLSEEVSLNVNLAELDLPFTLPPLFQANGTKSLPNLSDLDESNMKIADSYLRIKNYQRASKQLQKVVKSVPNYLPARIGYASALEGLMRGGGKAGDANYARDISLTYAEAAKISLMQAEPTSYKVNGASGDGGMPEAILRRALEYALRVSSKDGLKLMTLESLAKYSHTAALASDIYHEAGVEAMRLYKIGSAKSNLRTQETDAALTTAYFNRANYSFLASIEYAKLSANPGKCHGQSLLNIGQLELSRGGRHVSDAVEHLHEALSCLLQGSVEHAQAETFLKQAQDYTQNNDEKLDFSRKN